jgi:uncharacterized protein YdhG (YjbR/CyaY superfamily)
VRAHIASRPPEARRALRSIAAAVRATAPGVADAFSYGIPAFRYEGRILVYYAAWKDHTSMYPASRAFERAHAKALGKLSLSHKGTLRFPLDKPVPVRIVRLLVKFRLTELKRRAK